MRAESVLKWVQFGMQTMTTVVVVAVAGCFGSDGLAVDDVKTPLVTAVEPAGQNAPGSFLEPPIEEPIRPLDAPGVSATKGDVDENGTVDENDLVAFGDRYIQYQDDGSFDAGADLDADGAITSADLRLLLDLINSAAPPAADRPAFSR